MDPTNSKRRRTMNTTNDQYEIYLEALENDYIMRSGTIDPTIDEGYLERKWDELTIKLNSIGQGPILTKENWKKRFKDWKNSTRAKYRKIKESQMLTGGGTASKVSITPLEERGLEVWGRVAVTGTPLVDCVGGLGHLTLKQPTSPIEDKDIEQHIQEHVLEYVQISNNEEEDSTVLNTPRKNKIIFPQSQKKKKKQIQPLNVIADELKDHYSENVVVFKELSNHIADFTKAFETRNKIEEKRLSFEIQI